MKARREDAKNAKAHKNKQASELKPNVGQLPTGMPPLEELFLITVDGLTQPCWRAPNGEICDVIYEDTEKYFAVVQKLRAMGRPEYRSWKDAEKGQAVCRRAGARDKSR